MFTVSQFRSSFLVQIFYSMRTSETVDTLLEKTRLLHGNTLFINFLNSTEIGKKPIRYIPVEFSLNAKCKPLQNAASKISELEDITGMTAEMILSSLKRKHNLTLLGNIFPALSDTEWAQYTKFELKCVLEEYMYWSMTISDALDRTDVMSAKELYHFFDKKVAKQLYNIGQVLQMDSSGWDLDSKIFHSILSSVKTNNKDFIKEWMENYTGILHYNASTKREYQSLLSWIVLSVISCHCKYKYNLWASKLEWEKAGYRLKKNAQMAFVFHYFSVSGSNDDSQDDLTDRYAGFGRKLSVVYNIDEVEGDLAGNKFYGGKHKIQELDDAISNLNIAVTFGTSNSAYYDLSADCIVMPNRAFFKNNNKGLISYYSTLLHEIVHWTGHQSRCNRNLSNESEEAYALEELVAEIGSAFLCARFGIAKSPRSSSIAYLTYWLNKFEEDKWIYQLEKAALLANKACYFICRKDSD